MQSDISMKRKDKAYNKPKNIPRIDNVISSLISSRPELSKLHIIVKILRLWSEVVGEKMSVFTKVEKYEKEILYIKVSSSVWRNEFFHIENEIKNKMNEKLGKIKIKKIVFL